MPAWCFRYPLLSRRSTALTIVIVTSLSFWAFANQGGQKIDTQVAVDIGAWSDPIDIGIVGIHAALLHTGKVLFWYYSIGQQTRTPAVLFDPVSGTVKDVTPSFDGNIFCSGMTILLDGRVLATGGQATSQPGPTAGIPNVSIFDPVSETWSQGNPMKYARWYPSNVEYPDGTILTLSGFDENAEHLQKVMETYNPATGQWTTLPDSADMPPDTDLYPRMMVLPNGKVFKAGYATNTQTFDPGTNTWTPVAKMNFGPRVEGGAVLLPDLHKVLIAGGGVTFYAGGTTSTEVIDFSAPTPVWASVAPMRYPRKHLNLVLLPDGNVLAVGGGGYGRYASPQRYPELYATANNTWRVMAPQKAQRTYHSTALLLPDGRVISAGSDFGSMATTVEIFSPPYLFRGARPTITSAPTALHYGQPFTIGTPDAASITRVALLRPGANTHANNFDQRYVNLVFSTQAGQLNVTAPGSPNHAPPGYYMLLILNDKKVPAIMPFVLLQ